MGRTAGVQAAVCGAIALAASGCLSVPTATGGADGGGGSGADATAGCTPLLLDNFADMSSSAGRWEFWAEPERSTAQVVSGSLTLAATGPDTPDGAGGYADISSTRVGATAETELSIDLIVSVAGEGDVRIAWATPDSSATIAMSAFDGTLNAFVDDAAGERDTRCTACPTVTEGPTTLRMSDDGTTVRFVVEVDGTATEIGTAPSTDGEVFVQAFANASAPGDEAHAVIERIAWLDCSGAP